MVAPILVQRMFDAAIAYETNTVTFQLSVPIQNDWNLVSVPGLHPLNQNVNTWWANRDPLANVYRYNGSYQPVTTVSPGIGYSLKHSGPQVYNTGDEWPIGGIRVVPHHPISGNTGWNLIGGYEISVATADITTVPSGLQSGPIYKYSSGYQIANTLEPGYGYWMKLTSVGQIILPETLSKRTEPIEYFPDDWGKIIITDATGINFILYAVNGEVDLYRYELPPASMTGMVDIRYSSNRIAEDLKGEMKTIYINGVTYPLTVKVVNLDVKIQDPSGQEINAELKSGEKITITNSSINKLNLLSNKIFTPIEYGLEQNYPNPFNPTTKIRFSISEAGNVKLRIYNILGQEICRLLDENKDIGVYTISFDASELNSGMYIYKLEVNGFTQTRKMTLIK
ncbi:MAG: T9SS type A sorting domain-containing protein [Ignavibacteriales bacterium]|nr:T9SS type A sorting domain-containing protein [Ignavibacteriales bacterium]